ncbi:MAG: flavohemoprotein [Deltaproteobacteria bacterium]|nr:flavohemoprotein [Kofleriaceae bacterium]
MTTAAVTLLRESFELAVEHEPALIERFYQKLFARAPHLAPMFRRDRAAQAEMLRGALVAVLDHIDNGPWLAATLGALGARHVGYGVTPAMYDDVGSALVATLAEACGARWTTAHARAWGDAYAAIVMLMLQGATDAQAPAPQLATRSR